MTLYSFCMRLLKVVLGFVGHSAVERTKENACRHRKRGSRQPALQSSKNPAQTPGLPLAQDIRAQGKDAVTTEAKVAIVLKTRSIENLECQSGSKSMQALDVCIQYGNTQAKSTVLTVRRKTRRTGTRQISCVKPKAETCHEVSAEGQSTVSFKIVTPELQSVKSQRHLAVSGKNPHHQTGEVSDASGVNQKGRGMCMTL